MKVYKKLAIKNHPDKGGNSSNFKLFLDTYNKINKLIKLQNSNKLHMTLKNNYENYHKNKSNINKNHIKFNIQKFNKSYLENRRGNPYDKGYGDIMNKNNSKEALEIQNTIGKYSKNKFNKVFENKKNKKSNEVVIYKIPEPLINNKNLNYSILGEDNIEDFTNIRINATDYKKAYVNNYLINCKNIKIKRQNLKDLKKSRENLNLEDFQIKAIEDNGKLQKLKEWKRLNNLKKYDNRLSQN